MKTIEAPLAPQMERGEEGPLLLLWDRLEEGGLRLRYHRMEGGEEGLISGMTLG